MDVDELVRDVPSLREYTEAYKDAHEQLPAKRNRHVSFSYRGSMHVNSNNGGTIDLLKSSQADLSKTTSRRALSNPKMRMKAPFDGQSGRDTAFSGKNHDSVMSPTEIDGKENSSMKLPFLKGISQVTNQGSSSLATSPPNEPYIIKIE